MAAATLSGCKTGRAAEDEPSKVATINVDAAAAVSSSSSKPAPADVQTVESDPNSNGGDSTQTPENPPESSESSESRDYDPNAYYTYMSKGAGVMIMGGENDQEKIEIPAAIKERTVVSISGSAKKTLFPKAKTIILPETLTEIHNYAFAGCKYLTEINIPSGVTNIGEGAFSGCASLTSIALPDSVTSIAYGAFDNNVEFTLTYRGMTFNNYNINDLYTMLN